MDKLKFYLHALKKIDVLIQLRSTGTPSDLANKLNVSIRSLHNYIKFLKSEYKAPIHYDRKNKTYYYTEDGNLDFGWKKANRANYNEPESDELRRLQNENKELKEIFKDVFKYNYTSSPGQRTNAPNTNKAIKAKHI